MTQTLFFPRKVVDILNSPSCFIWDATVNSCFGFSISSLLKNLGILPAFAAKTNHEWVYQWHTAAWSLETFMSGSSWCLLMFFPWSWRTSTSFSTIYHQALAVVASLYKSKKSIAAFCAAREDALRCPGDFQVISQVTDSKSDSRGSPVCPDEVVQYHTPFERRWKKHFMGMHKRGFKRDS